MVTTQVDDSPAAGTDAWGPTMRARSRPWRSVLTLVLVVLLAVAVLAPLWASRQVPRLPVSELASSGSPLNILVVGSDDRAESSELVAQAPADGEGWDARTDTIFILSVQGRRAAMLAFPRDLWVERCDGSSGRINAAEVVGGPSCLVRTVQDLSGIDVHHYLRITFGGFVDLVDAAGGVELCLEDPIQDADAAIDLPAGCQRLDGADALGFVRVRKIDDDFQRIQRQQRFVQALAREIATPSTLLNPVRLVGLTREAGDTIAIDEGAGVRSLVRIALGGTALATGSAPAFTVPGEPRITAGGAWVLDPHLAEAEALFAAFRDGSVLRPDDEDAAPLDPSQVRVRVLNGAGIAGLASSIGELLGGRGFEVVEVGNTDPENETVVLHPPGSRGGADLVADDLPGRPPVRESTEVTVVTVLLGRDAMAP
jgi:LCP family protein required for cell wall assembly